MNDLHAKPIIDNKFWIVEQDGAKVANSGKEKKSQTKMILLFSRQTRTVKFTSVAQGAQTAISALITAQSEELG